MFSYHIWLTHVVGVSLPFRTPLPPISCQDCDDDDDDDAKQRKRERETGVLLTSLTRCFSHGSPSTNMARDSRFLLFQQNDAATLVHPCTARAFENDRLLKQMYMHEISNSSRYMSFWFPTFTEYSKLACLLS